jgi:hypothetical protein
VYLDVDFNASNKALGYCYRLFLVFGSPERLENVTPVNQALASTDVAVVIIWFDDEQRRDIKCDNKSGTREYDEISGQNSLAAFTRYTRQVSYASGYFGL